MRNIKYYYLDQLISGYFNQDYDTINEDEDTTEGIVKRFTTAEHDWILGNLIEEIDDFVSTNNDDLEKEFEKRFGFDFEPELWETTAHDFLMTVRQIATEERESRDGHIYEKTDSSRSGPISKLNPLYLLASRRNKDK